MDLAALLYVPADQPRLLEKSTRSPADAVVLDLEDAVPYLSKGTARLNAVEHLRSHGAWVRINEARTKDAAADCDSLASSVNLLGVRIPKVEDPADVEWVTARLPEVPLICAIESARGMMAAAAIAATNQVSMLSLGGVDFLRDLGVQDNPAIFTHLRIQLVLASAAAGIGKPIDRVYPFPKDDEGLRRDAVESRDLGFGGKSALSPRQVQVIQSVFSVPPEQVTWARAVLSAFNQSGGRPTTAPDGSFVDLPVAERAKALLLRAGETR